MDRRGLEGRHIKRPAPGFGKTPFRDGTAISGTPAAAGIKYATTIILFRIGGCVFVGFCRLPPSR
jgi:hypothetical protein